jgi:hypothetical protein
MARQFREQLEEEVQLEQARKAQQAQRAAAPTSAEPVSTAAPTAGAAPEASAGQAPHPGNGSGEVSPDSAPNPYSTDHHDRAVGAEPSATEPTQAAGADERRT